jgi:uncharacterized protein YjbI with pentapeptide repeats
MSQQRPNARRISKRPTGARGEQKQVSGQSEPSSLPSTRPLKDDRAAWLAYWQEQNQPWRTEPEISPARRAELEKCRALVPDVEKGIYPFKGMKLDRADVEWLLATHDGGPVKRSNEKERVHEGLDVRGADLQHADRHQLPLTRLHGGLMFDELLKVTEEQRSSAVVLMRGANLSGAQLAGANLIEAQLAGAILSRTQLAGANLSKAQLAGANLMEAQLAGAILIEAQLARTDLSYAQLKGAYLSYAQLEGASLVGAQLAGADLVGAQLAGASLRNVVLGDQQRIGPRLADLRWGDTNLAVVDWSQVDILGDEREARQKKMPNGKKKEQAARLSEYQAAVRANRQLAVALQAQGISEEAARFAYRAQRLQRIVLRRQRKLVAYLFSGVLDLLAGYGYRPGRSVIAYLVVIVGFMGLYLLNAHFVAPHLRWDEALVLSVSSFHGRGFFSQDISLGDTYARLAAAEAVVGLLIEISFIATFTQRFFGK